MHAVKVARHPGITEMELTELRAPRRAPKIKLDWKRLGVYVGLLTMCVAFWYGLYALMAH